MVAALTEEEFCRRAKLDPEFSECFGLFPFIYQAMLSPIEEKLYGDALNTKEIEGFLEKEKGESVYNQVSVAVLLLSAHGAANRPFKSFVRMIRDGLFYEEDFWLILSQMKALNH